MTGQTILGIDPLISTQQHAAGLNNSPGIYRDFQAWQLGFTFQMPLGMRAPLANVRQAQYTLLEAARLPPAGRPPDDPLAGSVLPRGRRQLQAVQDRLAAPGRRRPAARGPAGVLRGRPDHDRPLPRRGQPVRQRRRPGGPVQDDATTSRSSRSRRRREPCSPTTTSRWPKARTRRRPTSRPATSRRRTGSSPIPPDGNYKPMPINGPAAVDPVDAQPAARGRDPRRPVPADDAVPDGTGRTAADARATDGPGRRAAHPLAGEAPARRPSDRRPLHPGRSPGRRPDRPAPIPSATTTCRRCRSRCDCPRRRRNNCRGWPGGSRRLDLTAPRGRPLDSEVSAPARFVPRFPIARRAHGSDSRTKCQNLVDQPPRARSE